VSHWHALSSHVRDRPRDGAWLAIKWIVMDNVEWTAGFARRFGLHYVDYATLENTPKQSATFYREVIARNGSA